MSALGQIADDCGVSARTLRRAGAGGLIRGDRGARGEVVIGPGEELYLRGHWPLLGALRAALRTEPRVACAVIFGSFARGEDRAASDLDLLVALRPDARLPRAVLAARIERAAGRGCDVVLLSDVESNPILFDEILRDGRPLVDRAGVWPALRARREQIERDAVRRERELARRARTSIDAFLAVP